MTGSTSVDVAVEKAPLRFAQRNRHGKIFGLTGPQAAVILGAVIVCVAAITVLQGASWPFVVAAGVAVVIATIRINGEPLLTTMLMRSRYVLRAATGQNEYVRDVTETATGPLQQDALVPGVRNVIRHKYRPLPGELGDVELCTVEGAGGFAYDRRNKKAAVTLGLRSRAWELSDTDAQQAAINGFATWLSSLEYEGGLETAVLRVRADRSASTELADYLDEHGADDVSEALDREYSILIREGSGRAFEFSSTVTLTFDVDKMSREISEAGGGLPGLGHVLDSRVASLQDGMEHAKVLVESWLTGDELNRMVAEGWDPIAAARRRAEGIALAPPVMSIRERSRYVRSNESWHTVTWVSEWPRSRAAAGFMLPLLMRGTSSRTVVLEVAPVQTAAALREVSRQLNDMDTASTLRQKLGFRHSRVDDRGMSDVEYREMDLVEGYGAIDFRGFVVSSAASEDELKVARNDIEQAAHRAMLNVAPMFGQQAAAFVTSVLPVPVVRK